MEESVDRLSLWPFLILTSGVLTLVVTRLDVHSFARPALVIWFLTVCPGMAWVRLLQVRDKMLRWTLAIAISLLLDLLLAMGMLYSSWWSPTWALIILVAIAGVGVSVSWIRTTSGTDSRKRTDR